MCLVSVLLVLLMLLFRWLLLVFIGSASCVYCCVFGYSMHICGDCYCALVVSCFGNSVVCLID